MQKRVLHIIDSFGSGGAETWLLACVQYLDQHPELNMQFDFLASGDKKGIYDDAVIGYGCKIFYEKYSLQRFFKFRKRFKEILVQNKYIAVHDHQDFVSGWHFLAGGSALPPVRISHLHNPWNFVKNYVTSPLRWFSFRMGRRLMAWKATHITGTSNAVMDEYGYNRSPYKKKRVAPAYCGFDVKRFSFDPSAKEKICAEFNWERNVRIALFAGRIGTPGYEKALNQKNPSFALSVAKSLVVSGESWKFIFAGFKGVQGEAMEDEVRASGLDQHIKFAGIRNDMPVLMSAADVLVFPSLWEGLGMVTVEAQAAGLRTIASLDVPEEAFVAKELAKRISLDKPANEWSEEIIRFCASPLDRNAYLDKMEASGFSINNSVQRLIDLYTNAGKK